LWIRKATAIIEWVHEPDPIIRTEHPVNFWSVDDTAIEKAHGVN